MKKVGYTESEEFCCLENIEQIQKTGVLEPLNLCYCGIEQCEPKNIIGPMKRENYVIHFVLSGQGILKVGRQEYHVREKQAFLIRPGQETTYYPNQQKAWKYSWIGFNGFKVESLLKEMGFREDKNILDLNCNEEITNVILEILEARKITYANELKRKSLLYAIVNYIVEEHEQLKVERLKEDASELYVQMALQMIMKSYDRKLRIADLAKEIGINRSYLTNIFKKKMNMSPQSFLIAYRLEKAAQLLAESDDTVKAIALSTGYDDCLSFSKAFKQKYHMTPSEFRLEKTTLVTYHHKGDFVMSGYL